MMKAVTVPGMARHVDLKKRIITKTISGMTWMLENTEFVGSVYSLLCYLPTKFISGRYVFKSVPNTKVVPTYEGTTVEGEDDYWCRSKKANFV
jgi:hypothetical protein